MTERFPLQAANDLEELRRIFEEELERKDAHIKQLQEENELLLKTALKHAEDRLVIKEALQAHKKTSSR